MICRESAYSFHKTPFVTVVVPCFQEVRNIRACLDSVLSDDYDAAQLEALVIDGMSTDGTREILRVCAQADPRISVIDNPGARKGRAFNLGFMRARGDIVMIIGAHARYPRRYVSRLVRVLMETGADNAGGVLVAAEGETVLSRAIAIAVSHPFAAGNARHRTGAKSLCNAESVFGGCYWKKVFDEVGPFNESLIRSQDREFNYRLRRNGGRIVLDPSVRCEYIPRQKLREYAIWCFEGGYWLFFGQAMTDVRVICWRNLVPPGFVVYHVAPVILAALGSRWAIGSLAPIALYWLCAVATSVRAATKRGSLLIAVMLTILFATTHYGYGLGSICGALRAFRGISAPSGRDRTSCPE